ncbi:hypothetical protein Tco_1208278 [Tanacetum coccineum]
MISILVTPRISALARTLSLLRKTYLLSDDQHIGSMDILDVVDIEVAELRDRVDDYPREHVDTLRVEVDGLHGSAAITSHRVQTLETALQEVIRSFGGYTRDLDSFGKKQDTIAALQQSVSRICSQSLEMASQFPSDVVRTYKRRRQVKCDGVRT